MNSDFNPQAICLNVEHSPIQPPPKKVHLGTYRTTPGEYFLKGPIPWYWVCAAGSQPGKAMHIAIAIWWLHGRKKTFKVALNLSRLKELGVSRDSARRGLLALERVKLVKVERKPGRRPDVTILLKQPTAEKNDHKKEGGSL